MKEKYIVQIMLTKDVFEMLKTLIPKGVSASAFISQTIKKQYEKKPDL